MDKTISWTCLCLFVAVSGCAPMEPAQEDREACLAAGHAPGSEAFDLCLEERLAQEFARPAGDEIDDLRVRIGPDF